MAKNSGFTRAPRLVQGALVQFVLDIGGLIPNIVLFQYNPEQISRTLHPFNADDVNAEKPGSQMPQVQPYSPRESINFSLELDATDDLEDNRPLTRLVGISERLAALEKLVFPSAGLIGDLANSVSSLFGETAPPFRQTVPVTLFIYGAGRIVPVRVKTMSVTETQHLPNLQPHHAEVSLSMEIVTPEDYQSGKSRDGALALDKEFAIAAYRLFRVSRDALALAHLATVVHDLAD